MYHYEYVTKQEAAPYKAKLIEVIHAVQDEIRDKFTFRFEFIGSSSRNMVTFDRKANIGFDFDVNLTVNDENEEYDPVELRLILRDAFEYVGRRYGYNKCENSTRVIKLKRIDYSHIRVSNSCDIAIVYEGRNRQQYIRYNKGANTFTWELQKQTDRELARRADYLRTNPEWWNEVRECYLWKKNNNENPDKHSRSLYAEAINECFARYRVD